MLRPAGQIHFKTDNDKLFAWSVEEIPQFGFFLSEVTTDLHADGPVGVMTDYEAKFFAEGKNINRCVATMEGLDGARAGSGRRGVIRKEDAHMKLMIASDVHGSAHFGRLLLDALDREQADRLLLLGDLLYHGPRNDLPQGYDPKALTAHAQRRTRAASVRARQLRRGG